MMVSVSLKDLLLRNEIDFELRESVTYSRGAHGMDNQIRGGRGPVLCCNLKGVG